MSLVIKWKRNICLIKDMYTHQGCWLRARTGQPVPVPSWARVMSQKGGAEPVTMKHTTTAHRGGEKPAGQAQRAKHEGFKQQRRCPGNPSGRMSLAMLAWEKLAFLSPCNLQRGHGALQLPPALVCSPGLWTMSTRVCGSSQQHNGPAFPCEYHTPQKPCTEEAFAGPSSRHREHECSDFFSASRWRGARPAPALAGHHQLSSCHGTRRAGSKPGLRSRLEMCWFAAARAAEGRGGGTATSSRCSWDRDVAKRGQEETIPWGSSNHTKPSESQGREELHYNLWVQDNYSVLHCVSRGEGSDTLSSVSLWNKNLQHF